MVRVTLRLTEEDLENVHVALGFAVALTFDAKDKEFGERARRRLEALHVAFAAAETQTEEDA